MCQLVSLSKLNQEQEIDNVSGYELDTITKTLTVANSRPLCLETESFSNKGGATSTKFIESCHSFQVMGFH